MKANRRISVMLMAMTIGALAANAQSAQRGTPHTQSQRKTSSAVTSKTQKPHSKQTQTRTAKQNANSREKTLQHATSNRTVSQKVSTTNNHNPRSDYRVANRSVEVNKTRLDPKSRTNYSSGNTQHRNNSSIAYSNNRNYIDTRQHQYYPNKRVKIHVHPVTYHNHYRAMYYPRHREIVWTRKMHNYYIGIYPGYAWRYPIGYRVQTISAFEARYNVGEVSRVYGRVYATWRNRETDDLLLFFGGEFPNQEFTLIVPGNIARRYSWNAERFFLGQHVTATGLITSFEGKPELVVKRKTQLDVY